MLPVGVFLETKLILHHKQNVQVVIDNVSM